MQRRFTTNHAHFLRLSNGSLQVLFRNVIGKVKEYLLVGNNPSFPEQLTVSLDGRTQQFKSIEEAFGSSSVEKWVVYCQEVLRVVLDKSELNNEPAMQRYEVVP